MASIIIIGLSGIYRILHRVKRDVHVSVVEFRQYFIILTSPHTHFVLD
jgi:hypothetical protein